MPINNIRDWVHNALETSTSADPHVVADELVDNLDPADIEDVLRRTLPAYVTQVATQRRASHFSEPAPASGNASPRWKSASIYLDRVYTQEGWKMLRDCTRDDLVSAANDRYTRAAQMRESADRYMALADYLDEQGVSKVGDLPEEDVRAVLTA